MIEAGAALGLYIKVLNDVGSLVSVDKAFVIVVGDNGCGIVLGSSDKPTILIVGFTGSLVFIFKSYRVFESRIKNLFVESI